jgi:hypothetical protein
VPLIVIVGTWEERNSFLLKKYNIEKQKQDCFGGLSEFFTSDGNAISTVWIRRFNYDDVNSIIALSHEIDHSALHIMDLMNIPILANYSNHAYIYLKEYFFINALKKLKAVNND